MTKVVLKLQFYQDKHRKKAMKIASGIEGLNSISMDKDMKLTVTGDVDAVELARKLRKLCGVEVISVAPEKDEKKNEDPKSGPNLEQLMVYHPLPLLYYYQHHYPMQSYYYDENPNGCVIC